jgi:hypothetical protein
VHDGVQGRIWHVHDDVVDRVQSGRVEDSSGKRRAARIAGLHLALESRAHAAAGVCADARVVRTREASGTGRIAGDGPTTAIADGAATVVATVRCGTRGSRTRRVADAQVLRDIAHLTGSTGRPAGQATTTIVTDGAAVIKVGAIATARNRSASAIALAQPFGQIADFSSAAISAARQRTAAPVTDGAAIVERSTIGTTCCNTGVVALTQMVG